MLAGMAYAPTVHGTPPTAAVIDTHRYVRARRATAPGGRLPPRHADGPAGTFLHEQRLAARGSDILIQWARAGTGQPQH
jgi:hypothetical protein